MRATIFHRFRFGLFALLGLGLWGVRSDLASAGEIRYVNNRTGKDQFNGRLAYPQDRYAGPFQTIRAALKHAQAGDTIVIAATDVPYYESVQLVGGRFSGLPGSEFTIIGNGAVISGAQVVPEGAWVHVHDNLWKFPPSQKGLYQLILDDKPVVEELFPHDGPPPAALAEGHWAHWRGEVYFQAAKFQDPNEALFEFAVGGTGMTLYHLHDVQIRDLTFRHFRIDGVAMPGTCERVLLKNVRSEQNGRAGFSAWGSNRVTLEDCTATGNRIADMRILKPSEVTSTVSEPSAPSTEPAAPAPQPQQ